MADPAPDLLEVGRIGRPHGVRGEVYVDLSTDRVERLAVGSRLVARHQTLEVLASRPSNGRWLVTFDGVTDRTHAERLTGVLLFAAPIHDPDALWVHELIGSSVVEVDGTDRGRCVSVLANPAHDLLELDSGALVPVTFVVSCVDGVTTIDVPDGLFDLSEPNPGD
ncbi:MAG: ribosome maturation factor RimM [Acidimicrobiia bacterium]